MGQGGRRQPTETTAGDGLAADERGGGGGTWVAGRDAEEQWRREVRGRCGWVSGGAGTGDAAAVVEMLAARVLLAGRVAG
ncbi:unnamed protein product [Linum trigynum]|uniref:Uncharacterized protein n=1 Tax=Linum trigynum TaxID=586398 RepID=A0AAV2EXC2_9ROSI